MSSDKSSPIEPQPLCDDEAILVLGEAGAILAARAGCVALLGWEPEALVHQNIRILLKAGLDNELGRALHQRRTEKNFSNAGKLRVTIVRKEGTELLASVTTLPSDSEDPATPETESTRSQWTISFRRVKGKSRPNSRAEKRVATKSSDVSDLPSPAVELDHKVPAPPSPEDDDRPIGSVDDGIDAAELRRQNQQLEQYVLDARSELESCRADVRAREQQWQLLEYELSVQLTSAQEALGYRDAALKEEIANREKLEERLQTLSHSLKEEQAVRGKRFEEELVSLRQERDTLNNKLTTEQQAAVESTRTAQELEKLLSRNAVEFNRAQQELEKQSAERERSESQWREQLDTAWVMKEQLEGAWGAEVERNKKFEEELAALRRESEELNRKLTAEQQAAAEALDRAKEVESRLGQNAAESEHAREQLEATDRENEELKWLEQLQSLKDDKKQLEADWAAALERNLQFEEEIAEVRRQRDELDARLKAEDTEVTSSREHIAELQRCLDRAQADLKEVQERLQQHESERDQHEIDWETRLGSAQTLAKKLETAWTTSVERNKRCEDELSGVRQERDSLKTRLAEKEQSVIDFKLQIAELEERLKRQMTEVKRLNAIRASQQNGHSKDAVAAPANPNNRQTEPKKVPVEQRGASQRKVCEPLKSSEDRSCNSQLLGGNAYDLKP